MKGQWGKGIEETDKRVAMVQAFLVLCASLYYTLQILYVFFLTN